MAEQPEENELERRLRLAATEPAERVEFYRVLLESTVHVLGDVENPDQAGLPAREGERMRIQNWVRADGQPIIPFFSSLFALRRALAEETSCLTLPARALFEATKGAMLVLNPRSQYAKELLPSEIESLLTTGLNRIAQSRTVTVPRQVLLGQPKEYPTKMVAALKQFLPKHGVVKAAYLALMHDATQDQKPVLLVGIEAEGNVAQVEQALREVGTVAAEARTSSEPVDVIRIAEGEEGVSRYLINSKPFYRRSWWRRS